MKAQVTSQTIREKQVAAKRLELVQVAMLLLSHGMDLSHELIAATAGINVKTVYGHFPDRASLVVELEKQLQEVVSSQFPATEEDIVPLGRKAFRSFNANAPLVRGVITAAASARRSNLPSPEARTAFITSLRPLLEDIPPRKRKAVIGCFVAVSSAPFWNLLRSRSELSSDETEEAAVWMLTTLLDSLQIGAASRPFMPSDRIPKGLPTITGPAPRYKTWPPHPPQSGTELNP